jgi:hypothetical protein
MSGMSSFVEPFEPGQLDPEPPKLLSVCGIQLLVYGLGSLSPTESSTPVAVAFLLHGRKGSREDFDGPARRLIASSKSFGPQNGRRDLVVVVFSQRNHGERLVDQRTNDGWRDDPSLPPGELANPSHAIDMHSIYSRSICLWVLGQF